MAGEAVRLVVTEEDEDAYFESLDMGVRRVMVAGV